jgi:sterol desaturase/sphingolipid hydroxylase (fatty acid hydroxylase superfamily)
MRYELLMRLVFFVVIFGVIAIWEHYFPRRTLTIPKKWRWLSNLSLMIGNPILIRLLLPIVAIDAALIAQQRSWGLLNLVDWPIWMEFVIGYTILDLFIYLQHVMFHAMPLLWRLHMIHHTDLDFDLTTGLRFHPIEAMLSMILKLIVIIAIGPSVAAVLTFEILLSGMAMFNHGNLAIGKAVDQWLRLLIVTPDMHRVHHSVIIRETNSNYGFNLSVWDRLFGTYCSQPRKGQTDMVIGLSQFRDEKNLTLPWLIILPAIGDPGKQPINRH